MVSETRGNIYHFVKVVDLMKLPKDAVLVHYSMAEVCGNEIKNEYP